MPTISLELCATGVKIRVEEVGTHREAIFPSSPGRSRKISGKGPLRAYTAVTSGLGGDSMGKET